MWASTPTIFCHTKDPIYLISKSLNLKNNIDIIIKNVIKGKYMKKQKKKTEIQKRKNNARLYPIYKMFSWDLIFYYSISFIFLVQTKNLSIVQVMFTDSLYPILKTMFQIPALSIIDKKGKKFSLLLGNFLLALFLLILIVSNNVFHVVIAYAVSSFAFALKNVAEPNLLYDSVTQRKGKGMFAKIEEIGSRNYYYLDGITSMFTGFLFIVNGYLPMIISLIFVVLSIGLSTCFKEIYVVNKEKDKKIIERIKEYKEEVTTSFKFIIQSKRLQAIMVFVFIFDGIIYTSYTLREGLLNQMQMPAQYFAIILSTLTIISGLFVSLQEVIHNKFKNRALTFMSIAYLSSFILIGGACISIKNWYLAIGVCLILFATQYAIQGPYYTLITKYLKSFATPKMRVKIDTTFNLIRSIAQFLMALLATYFLNITTPKYTFIILGTVFIIIMIFVLQWMKSRFGLKPEEYNQKDIKFK